VEENVCTWRLIIQGVWVRSSMMILRQFLCDHLVQICVMMPMLLRATYKDFKEAQSPHLGELLLLYSPRAI